MNNVIVNRTARTIQKCNYVNLYVCVGMGGLVYETVHT